MTLILSTFATAGVVQVSDRRLTMPDGQVIDEAANKAICLWCADAQVAVAFSGIAVVDSEPTSSWLVNAFLRMDASRWPLVEVGLALRDELNGLVGKLHRYTNPGLTLTFSGYREQQLFWGNITNNEDERGAPLTHASRQFQMHSLRGEQLLFGRSSGMVVNGEVNALGRTVERRLKKYQRRFSMPRADVTATQMVSIVRSAASDRKYGVYIGRNCTAIIVLPNGRFQVRAFPDKSTKVSYLPDVVSLGGALVDLEFTAH